MTKFAFSIKPSKKITKGQKTTSFSYKPNKYLFKNPVFVVTNGITFSQAALVASQLKENGATFFGQETGGAALACNGILNYDLILPNSQIAVTIPMYHVFSNLKEGIKGYGVQPNYYIPPTLNNTEDETLRKVINHLIGNN